MSVRGSCLCGGIAEMTGTPRRVLHCHYYEVPDAKHFMHVFCRVCGSSMPRFDEGRGFAVVPMGAFDDDPGARPEGHIFVDSKAPWADITDALPRHPGPPPSI